MVGDCGADIIIISFPAVILIVLEFEVDPVVMVQVGIKLKPDESKLSLTYINFEFVNMADIYFDNK